MPKECSFLYFILYCVLFDLFQHDYLEGSFFDLSAFRMFRFQTEPLGPLKKLLSVLVLRLFLAKLTLTHALPSLFSMKPNETTHFPRLAGLGWAP